MPDVDLDARAGLHNIHLASPSGFFFRHLFGVPYIFVLFVGVFISLIFLFPLSSSYVLPFFVL